jgi:hypothetical protein
MNKIPCKRALIPFAFFLVISAAAHAQLSLDKSGGALGGNATFNVQGTAGHPYVIIWSDIEQPTTVAGTTFDITLTHLLDSFSIPGFAGVLGGTGAAQAVVPLPNVPALDPIVVSLQSASGLSAPFNVSNLIRLTPSAQGAFENALNDPLVPIGGGGFATASNGELLFVGGSGPIAQRYHSRTEEWELAGLTFGVGLFGQATGLADGRILFTGGLDAAGQPTNAAAVYDPVAQTTTTLAMGNVRAGHGASLMGNGKVLITGGFQTFDLTNLLTFLLGVQASTEIFDPLAMTFSPGPAMLEPRGFTRRPRSRTARSWSPAAFRSSRSSACRRSRLLPTGSTRRRTPSRSRLS